MFKIVFMVNLLGDFIITYNLAEEANFSKSLVCYIAILFNTKADNKKSTNFVLHS